MDDVPKKQWGLSHFIATVSTIAVAAFGGEHVYKYAAADESPATRQEMRDMKIDLTDRLDKFGDKLDDLIEKEAESHAALQLLLQARKDLKLRTKESRAVINKHYKQGG